MFLRDTKGRAIYCKRIFNKILIRNQKKRMTTDRDIEKKYSKKGFIKKLRRLADALEDGKRFSIQIAGERIFIPKNVIVSIEHEREGREEEIEFQIKWKKRNIRAKYK